jgi:hypothetical protein
MINFYKLEKLLKIWMESIKEKDEKWYKTTGFADKEDGWMQEYALSTTGDTCSDKFKPRTAYIHCIKGMPSETKLFNICLDKKDNPVLVISSDGEVLWKCIDIDTDQLSEKFTGGNISKLRDMIINADKTLEDYLKEHPKFDMDEDHSVSILEVVFKEPERIEIRFVANNRIFNRNNKLYVGFDGTDEDGREWNYVFKVTEKHIPIRHGYSFALSGYPIPQPFQEYVYTAEFHGYFRPTEEEILNATFRWVVSDEVIKTANKEARYT